LAYLRAKVKDLEAKAEPSNEWNQRECNQPK
jgi:hypothetical protein